MREILLSELPPMVQPPVDLTAKVGSIGKTVALSFLCRGDTRFALKLKSEYARQLGEALIEASKT